jgi:hypothetical protein
MPMQQYLDTFIIRHRWNFEEAAQPTKFVVPTREKDVTIST